MSARDGDGPTAEPKGGQRWGLDAILSTIAGVRRRGGPVDVASIEADCRSLLALGPDGGKRMAHAILSRYALLDADGRVRFFRFLADDLDLDPARLSELADDYGRNRSADALAPLLAACEPPRQELLRRLNAQPGATVELVAMRADLLAARREEPDLARADLDFAHLFSSWFNRGFLDLQRVTWDTPASVLAKIIAYEAVHEINGWDDLRSRLEPADRRCYAFFHPAMPGEPLVFTEVALVRGVPASVQRVLDEGRDSLNAVDADTAVFYSISNCQRGLRGVSFGNLLIKQVVADLARELPGLKRFLTLSPLPGLAAWMEREGLDPSEGELLTARAAYYLAHAKRADGEPLDPVARFHLSNGARIDAIHADADTSENGIRQSHGVMVNYLYDLSRVEPNQEAFAASGSIALSRPVRELAGRVRRERDRAVPEESA